MAWFSGGDKHWYLDLSGSEGKGQFRLPVQLIGPTLSFVAASFTHGNVLF
jgi:hypothetical protein